MTPLLHFAPSVAALAAPKALNADSIKKDAQTFGLGVEMAEVGDLSKGSLRIDRHPASLAGAVRAGGSAEVPVSQGLHVGIGIKRVDLAAIIMSAVVAGVGARDGQRDIGCSVGCA